MSLPYILPIAILAATVISGRVGWYLALIILNDPCSEPNLPHWLIEMAPLKGRWLRLLLAAPGIGILMLSAFLLAGIGLCLTNFLAPVIALVLAAMVVEYLPLQPLVVHLVGDGQKRYSPQMNANGHK
jgi:hypothetical protein